MSEYQYYEFQAIDRPLDQRAMAALRAITSRARITPTSLVNVYHFGDFKGDPDRLMDQYFDAHLYVANWGTRRLLLRLPARAFPLASAKPYAAGPRLRARATKAHVVLDFHSDSEAGGEDFQEGEGLLAGLIPLRADLLAGDPRCLYLGWLAGVRNGEVDPRRVEPPVPPGLRQPSAPLRGLIDQPKEYDRAVELLKDLRDLAERTATAEVVARRIRELRARHGSKPTLMQRLGRAGLSQ